MPPLLSALPLDFSRDRLNDLKASPYFGAINAMIESGVSFDSIKDTNTQLNLFLVNIDESHLRIGRPMKNLQTPTKHRMDSHMIVTLSRDQ